MCSSTVLDRGLHCTCLCLIIFGAIDLAQFLSYQLLYGIFGGVSGVLGVIAGSIPLCCMTDVTRRSSLTASLGLSIACIVLDLLAITWQILVIVGVNSASLDEGWASFLNTWVGVALAFSVISLLIHSTGVIVFLNAIRPPVERSDPERGRPTPPPLPSIRRGRASI